jgi:hypothetical protein
LQRWAGRPLRLQTCVGVNVIVPRLFEKDALVVGAEAVLIPVLVIESELCCRHCAGILRDSARVTAISIKYASEVAV